MQESLFHINIKVEPDWWKSMFDEVYLLTDARSICDEEVTRCEVDLICKALPILPEHKILDLCGGHGRHSFELYSRGFTGCTLVDYSRYLTDYASRRAAERNYRINFIRADARCTGLAPERFDHVLIMGNSLGYIQEPSADGEILAEAMRVLRPGGWLLIDVADGLAVKNCFSPEAWHEVGVDIVVCRRRKMEENIVCSREIVISRQKGLIRDRTYSIRLYEAETIEDLLEQAGFKQVNIYTDFSPHLCAGDYGFMNRRILGAAQKP